MTRRVPAPLTFTGRQLTVAEAADLLNVSLNTIRRMIYRGELRARRFGTSRVLRIDPADLAALGENANPLADPYLGGDAA